MLITADLHCSDNPRDGYRLRWFERFIKLAQQKRPSMIVVLGDLTEEKDRHAASLVNTVVDNLYALTQVCPVYGLQGNHDYTADPDNGFWPFLSHIHNLTWITRPTGFKFDGQELLFLPHTRDYKRDWKDLQLKGYDWIFAHNAFEGALSEHGHKLEGIPISTFPRDARVISGDVHKPQMVGPVEYVGAPYLCDFGDDYTPRVLWLDRDGSKRSLACPGPQKRLVDIRSPAELELQKHVRSGDILKVRVQLAMKDRERWPKIRKAVEDWAEDLGCVLHACQPQFKLDPTKPGVAFIPNGSGQRSDTDILKKFAAARGLSEAVLKAGLDFLE